MTETKILIDNKAVPVSETKVQFGALSAPTPLWATWVFRITFIVTTAMTFWIGSTGLLSNPAKIEIITALKSLDMVVLGLSKLLGIVPNSES